MIKRMKALLLISLLFLQGCGVEDYFDGTDSVSKFNDMCSRSALYICDYNVTKVDTKNVGIEAIYDYIDNYLLYDDTFVPTLDNGDKFNYLIPGEDGVRRGDCEDFAITILEDNIVNGNIAKGEAKLVKGYLNGSGHVWLELIKEGTVYIFDTNNYLGNTKEDAFFASQYRHIRTLYSY